MCAHNVYIHTCNKADDNSDTANSLSFPPQYLNNNHVTFCVSAELVHHCLVLALWFEHKTVLFPGGNFFLEAIFF